MTREGKVEFLRKLTAGEAKIKDITKPKVGPVLIQMSEDEYKCFTSGRTLTKDELEEEQAQQMVKVSFVIPDNGRDGKR